MDDDDWVATPQGEILDLIARVGSPQVQETERARARHRLDLLVTSGALEREPESGTLTFKTGKVIRSEYLNAERKAAKGTNYFKDGLSLEQLAAETASRESCRLQEVEIQKLFALDSTKVACEVQYPMAPFETRSGPCSDRSQIAIPWFKGKGSADASQTVTGRLHSIQHLSESRKWPTSMSLGPLHTHQR